MSDHKDPKLNSAGDDLIDVKALIRDAAPASCTLEDILAEYGATPKPAPRPTRPGGGQGGAFPGTAVLPPPVSIGIGYPVIAWIYPRRLEPMPEIICAEASLPLSGN